MLEWKPQPIQEEALLADVYELLFGGQRGGGKTDTGQVWLVDPDYIKNPRYRALVIRKDATDLSDWMDRARWMYGTYKAEIVGNPPYIRFPSGAVFRTGYLKDKDSYERHLGHEYQKILIEELTQIPEESYYIQILGSCRSTIEGLKPKIFCTTNPGGRGHGWVKKRFIDPVPPKTIWTPTDTGRTRLFIPAGIEDNPILMERDPDYVKYLDGLREKNEKLYKAWRLGDWNVFTGQYFTEFEFGKHIIKPFTIPEQWKKYRSIDWGYRPDPAVCCWYASEPNVGYIKYREIRVNEMTPKEFGKYVTQLGGNEVYEDTVADPSVFNKDTGVSIAEQMFEGGLSARKADNQRVDGWNRLREYLAWHTPNGTEYIPRLRFFDTCIHTIESYPTLVHDDRHPEDIEEGDDHVADCDRYFVMSRPLMSAQDRPKEDPEVAWIRQDFQNAINYKEVIEDPILGINY